MSRVPPELRDALVIARCDASLDPKVVALISNLAALCLELYETILMERSYAAENYCNNGWFYHGCMADQEEAIAILIECGRYETHPDHRTWFRRKPEVADV